MSTASTRRTRVLVVHDCLPHYDRSGADLRLMQIVHSLLRHDCDVTFVARFGGDGEVYRPPLEKLGIKVYAHDAQNLRYAGIDAPLTWNFSQILREGRFDVAILCLWFWGKISVPEQYLPAIRQFSPRTFVVVLTDDRHGLRERRMAELTHSLADEERGMDYEQREIEVLRQADMVAAISEDDRRGLLKFAPELPIEILPIVAQAMPPGPVFESRKNFLFLANFQNEANRDALYWLVREIWPALRGSLPGTVLTLAGSAIPDELCSRSGIDALGHIDDLTACANQHRIFLSPIRFGTGIKTKNVMALSHGLPLVTTTIGAEGLGLEHEKHVLIADGTREFAAAAEQLYRDANLWERLRAQGWQHILLELSSDRLDRQVAVVLDRATESKAQVVRLAEFFSQKVEEQFPEVLSHGPAIERLYLRAVKHLELASERLREGSPQTALRHLRHTFALYPASKPGGSFFEEVYRKLAEAYRAMGDRERASRCEWLARTSAPKRKIGHYGRGSKKNKVRRSLEVQKGERTEIEGPDERERATIGLAMIVRNAAKDLPICLESVRNVVQEIVIADTGSTDNTCEIASRYGARIVSVPWQQDFSAARNAAIALVRSEWVLVVDSDEELDPRTSEILPKLLRRAGVYGFRVPLRHYLWNVNARGWDQRARRNDSTLERAKPYPAYVQQEIVRLFRRSTEIYFEGRVHEMVDRSILRNGGKIGDATFCIHHYGHVAGQSTLTEKNNLYRDLGRLKVQDMPNDAHAHLELGLQEMDNFSNYEEAQKCFDRAAQLEPANYTAWLFAGMAALRRGHYADALQRLRNVPRNCRCAALLAETQAEACYNLQQFENAAEHYRRALKLNPESAPLESKTGFCELRLGHMEAGLMKLKNAIERSPTEAELHDRLTAAYVSLGKLAEAASAAERRIEQAGPVPEAFLRAASIRAQLQDWSSALQLLQRGLELYPNFGKLQAASAEAASALAGKAALSQSAVIASATGASPCPDETTIHPPRNQFAGQSSKPSGPNSTASM
jgi:glycosyltransferase involved in cell wall biosynthesis